jgi:arsenite methyltransferase
MSDKNRVRAQVAEAYASAVESKGCVSGPQCTPAALAGYRPEDVSGLPEEAAGSSFGCGNPVAFANVQEGDVVLDLGSGAGMDLLLAARKVGPAGRVIGVDMTPAMIAQARRSVAAAGLTNVDVRQGLIEELPVDSASVDWVISNCVINLSPEKARVFSEIHRVLKPGGRISIADIVAQELPKALQESASAYVACLGGAISEQQYVAGLQTAGLHDVEVAERLVYDVDQIRALLPAELIADALPALIAGNGGTLDEQSLRALIGRFVNQIWSARFRARKPL